MPQPFAMEPGRVYFVGAGPGDPGLMTVRGREIVEQADTILFAGSLVQRDLLDWARPDCAVHDSKGMALEAITELLIGEARAGRRVARVATGDPTLYGSLLEIVIPLEEAGIPYRVVPGVSSAFAAAGAAGESLTVPESTQTVIFSRVEGRTPMPEGEDLVSLARHHATLCLFLSVTLLGRLQDGLREAGWAEDAPVLVVHKAEWPGEELVLRTTLAGLRDDVKAAGINSQSMIIASPALAAREDPERARSKLYDPTFSHRHRQASQS